MSEKDTSIHHWLAERRYFPLIIASVFIILSISAFFICYRHHVVTTEQVLHEDRFAANLLSLFLNEHLNKVVSVMESYSHRPLLIRAAKEKNAEKATVHLINLTERNPDIDSVIITDRQGTLWAAYPERPEALGKSFAYRDWYQCVSKEWRPYISDAYLRVVAEKDLAVAIGVPVINEKGKAIGILHNTYRAVSISHIIKQLPLNPGVRITVADRKGQLIHSTRYNVEKEIKFHPFHADMKKSAAANHKTFAVVDHEFGGKTRYLSFAPVGNIGWTVLVGRYKRSIFMSEIAYYVQVTAIALLLFLSVVVFLFHARKQVTVQLIREQLEAEKKISAGQERFKSYIDVTMQLAWMTNDKGEIVEEIPSWSKYTGRGYEAYQGFGWIEDIHPDDRDRTGRIWGKTVAEKSFYENEYRVRRYDGVYRVYLARGIPLLAEDGTVREWVGTCIDITDRKKAEEELVRSEQFLASVIEQNPTSTWISDGKGTLVKMNRACRELFGVTEAEVVGKFNILKDNLVEAQGHMPLVRDVFEKGTLARFTLDYDAREVTHIDVKTGRRRILDVVVSPIRDAQGRVTNAIVQHKDVTDLRHAEEERDSAFQQLQAANQHLRATEKQLRQGAELLNATGRMAKVGGWEVDAKTLEIKWTEQTYRLHEVPLDHRPPLEEAINFFHPEEQPKLKDAIHRALEHGEPYDMEIRFITAMGNHLWTRTRCEPEIVDGKTVRLKGVFQDITERKQAEKALQESEKKYRLIVETAKEGVWSMDSEYRTAFVNKAMGDMLGYEPAEMLGRRVDSFMFPEDFGNHLKKMEDRKHGRDSVYERRFRCKNGEALWAIVSAGALHDEQGNFAGSFAMITDITERKRAEKDIRRLNEELEQRVMDRTAQLEAANKELEAFSYSVSHDLRAPLRAIDGFSHILMKEYTDRLDDEGVRLLNVIRTNAKQMDQLITDMLSLSRVSKSEMKLSLIDMTTLAHSIYQEVVPPEVRRKFGFSVAPLPDGDGDPVLLRHVWSNLLSNAVKFTLPREERRIEISGHKEKGMNIYAVRDTGVGFNPNYVHKLFGIFQRLHKSSEFEGNGVGLAIVRRIVERHGGRVWAEGKINEGAAFFFSLPIKEVKDEPHE